MLCEMTFSEAELLRIYYLFVTLVDIKAVVHVRSNIFEKHDRTEIGR